MPDIYQYPSAPQQIKNELGVELINTKIEFGNGIRMYQEGCDFPNKGLPTAEAVSAVNHVKKLLLVMVKTFGLLLLLKKKKKLISAFEELAFPIISPFILKEEFQQVFTKELTSFITLFMLQLGLESSKFPTISAHIFEYDWAYRLRLQDLFSETNKEALIKSPRKEIKRLMKLNQERDMLVVSKKFRMFFKIALLILFVPRVKHALKEALLFIEFKNLQFDEGDMYWALQRTEYDTMGKTFGEREEMLKEYKVNKGRLIYE